MAKRIAYDYSKKHLLVVAAVSGSGKTTFIRGLTSRRLMPEILSALPEDAWTWSIVGSRAPHWVRQLFFRQPQKPRGQIREYDIMLRWAYRPRKIDDVQEPSPHFFSVDTDENFKIQLAASEEVHVVIVRTPASRIIQQLPGRSIMRHAPPFARSLPSRYVEYLLRLERALPSWITDNASKMLGRRWRKQSNIREREAMLMKFYAQEGALNSVFRHYEASLAKACGSRLKRPFLYVEPALGQADTKSFRLLATQGSAERWSVKTHEQRQLGAGLIECSDNEVGRRGETAPLLP